MGTWVGKRSTEMRGLLESGKLPSDTDMEKFVKCKSDAEKNEFVQSVGGEMPSPTNVHLCGQVAGAVKEILPAKVIVESMVEDACKVLQLATARISAPASRL